MIDIFLLGTPLLCPSLFLSSLYSLSGFFRSRQTILCDHDAGSGQFLFSPTVAVFGAQSCMVAFGALHFTIGDACERRWGEGAVDLLAVLGAAVIAVALCHRTYKPHGASGRCVIHGWRPWDSDEEDA